MRKERAVNFFFVEEQAIQGICVFCASIIKHGVLTDDVLIPKKEREKNTSDTLTV